jgi:DNA polymerase-3 subunit delta'
MSVTVLHPRETTGLIGHGQAERVLGQAAASGRLAHAWLITGPRGIGKATLAYRFARYLLAGGEGGGGEEGSLALAPDHPVFQRIAARGHGDLRAIERGVDPKTKRARKEIVVDDVRGLHDFFTLTSSESGWRIAIIDAADEMNRNAANAVLKILEEPPPRGLLLLVSHAPGRLLPTIRSRCRRLALRPLGDAQLSATLAAQIGDLDETERHLLARLAQGSPGHALYLAASGGLEVYRSLCAILSSLPRLDMRAAHALADKLNRREAQDSYAAFGEMIRTALAAIIRAAATGHSEEGEDAPWLRLGALAGLDQWLEVWDKIGRLIARGDAVNLERKQVVLNIFISIQKLARG